MKELLQDDVQFLKTQVSPPQQQQIQIFRPLHGHGIGLHYRFIRDPSIILQMASFILLSGGVGGGGNIGLSSLHQKLKLSENHIENEVEGVILCVGFSGYPLAHSSSSLQYSLTQKFDDCLSALSKILQHVSITSKGSSSNSTGSASKSTSNANYHDTLAAAKMLLSTILLFLFDVLFFVYLPLWTPLPCMKTFTGTHIHKK